MDQCPQCSTEVPTDNAFCGKCGYAMRDQVPHNLNRSRIRVHEEPEPPPPPSPSKSPRAKTVLGMPTAISTRPPKTSPDTSPASPRSMRSRSAQKTMLGIPHPDLDSATEAAVEPESRQQFRQRGFGVVGLLVLLSSAWLVYRFVLAGHG